MNRFRPKLLFIFATFFTSMAVILLGIFAFLDKFHPNISFPSKLSWIPIAIAAVPAIMRAIGIVPVLHSLLSEVFPTEIRLILHITLFKIRIIHWGANEVAKVLFIQ